jgi:hypothetical protein
MQTAFVRSKLKEQRVAAWEKHPAHPGGEIYVAGPVPVMVAMTTFVHKRIAEGYIEVVEKGQPAPKGSKDEQSPAPAEPFEGYSKLNVEQVIERLATLTEEERAAVLAYEHTHGKRKGVLAALEGK